MFATGHMPWMYDVSKQMHCTHTGHLLLAWLVLLEKS